VPADGFFEWQSAPAGVASRRRSAKVPYFIHRRDDALFAFAGLYEHWRDPAGQDILSYTVITTTANAVVAPLHDRMPVILLPEDETVWLADDGAGPEAWQSLLRPVPDDLLEAFPVSALVNSPAHDQPDVLVPAR
jgi:putative SOS response-associated peptidase YedK